MNRTSGMPELETCGKTKILFTLVFKTHLVWTDHKWTDTSTHIVISILFFPLSNMLLIISLSLCPLISLYFSCNALTTLYMFTVRLTMPEKRWWPPCRRTWRRKLDNWVEACPECWAPPFLRLPLLWWRSQSLRGKEHKGTHDEESWLQLLLTAL